MKIINKIIPLIALSLPILNSCGESSTTSYNHTRSSDRLNKNVECIHINSKKTPLFEQIVKLEKVNKTLMDLFYTNIGSTTFYYGLTDNDMKSLQGIMLVENSNVLQFRYTATNILATITNYCSSDFMEHSDVKQWKDYINEQFREYTENLKNNYNKISTDINNEKLKNDFKPMYQNGIIKNAEGLDQYL